MIFIYYLLFFILGAVSIEQITPIIESLVSLFLTYLEEKKGKIAVKIAKIQLDLEDKPEKTPAIGFEWASDEEEGDELEDD